jgi:hypothetical protein
VGSAAAGQEEVETSRDGEFEVTVSKVDCGATRVRSDLLDEKAQGVFCLVDVTVKNIGDEALRQRGQCDVPRADQPRNSVKGKLVLDVPEGTALTSVRGTGRGQSSRTKVTSRWTM